MMGERSAARSGSRPGENAHEHGRKRSVRLLEWLTVLHVGFFAIATSWAFGGQSDWVRGPLIAWGSLGALITLARLLEPRSEHAAQFFPWWWAAPLLALNVIVIAAASNPNFREVSLGAETLLVPGGERRWLPSSARPASALQALWQFDAIWLACFNIGLVIRRRRTIRILLLVLALNALALAIFGSAQKLSGSSGLFFGAVPSPQKYFFASFVYHNHWGAFTVLMLAASIAIVSHYVRRHEGRDFFHSPAMAGAVGILILALSVPLSASRSCTLLTLVLLAIVGLRWMMAVLRQRRRLHESVVPPIMFAVVAASIALLAGWNIARDVIRPRITLTLQQVQHAKTSGAPDARVMLYEDTWRMAIDRPWFGWGPASYPHVFTLYNRRESVDRLPVFYHDAHSDWLQSLAEHGFVGTLLLILTAALPFWMSRTPLRESVMSRYLLVGCGLIIAYAAFEFPFGNFAVVLVWWLCFYSAIHYARLTAASSSPRS